MTSILPISTTANLCAIAISSAYSQRMSDEDNVIPAPVARSANLELAKQTQEGKIKQNTRSAYERKVSILYAFFTHTTMMLRRDCYSRIYGENIYGSVKKFTSSEAGLMCPCRRLQERHS